MKKYLIIIALAVIVIIAFGFYITGYLDPFGALPKGISSNCGPEDRYKFDVKITNKEDFVNFLKTDRINQFIELDNFKKIDKNMSYEDIKSAEVDWNEVLKTVKTENSGFRNIYVLNYNPYSCSGFILKMTENGHVSVYGCCGK